MSFRRSAGLIGIFVVLACYITWPQCLSLATRVASHDDGFFSTWRLAWIAHALWTNPAHLYDANIFFPDLGTLANSDAVILEGALASPFLWAGASPMVVYNVLLLAGYVTSGLAMFVLARHLTGNDEAALVAGAVFMMVPYRVEHFEHLELQWACFIPLTFWMAHRAFDRSSFRDAVLAGVLVWIQLTACVYYGVYLALIIAALSVLLLAVAIDRKRAWPAFAGLAAGGVITAILSFVSMRPYIENMSRVGTRPLSEIGVHSAVLASYVSAPAGNWIWGWSGSMFPGDELHLFPGAIATALALAGLAAAPRRVAIVYAVVLALAVELSLGLNGRLYPWLLEVLTPLHGLRATARASIFAFAALAVLAGFGVHWLRQKWPSALRSVAPCVVVLAALAIEFGSAPMQLQPVHPTPPVYQLLRQLPKGPLAELPMPLPRGGSGYDPLYMYSAVSHWFPLVNGYSGYIPEHYQETLDILRDFPSDASFAHLRRIGTRYVIVHEHGYERDEYMAIIAALRARSGLVPFGRYGDVEGRYAELFELAPAGVSDGTTSLR